MFPILEYDTDPEAVIEPSKYMPKLDAPERCILCFFREVIRRMDSEGLLKVVFANASEMGPNPLYEFDHHGTRIGLMHPGVGAPLAGGFMDETIALGCRKFIAVGSCGVLNREITKGHLVVPTSAIRDEGTSYHYLPPAREVEPSLEAVVALEKVLISREIPYLKGKTWTTDGIFRETRGKVKQRRAEGCLTVEMEAAAFFAVAKFRGVQVAQLLYGSDDVSGEEWDQRSHNRRLVVRELMVELAAEALVGM